MITSAFLRGTEDLSEPFAIRRAVFIEEQGVPEAEEYDGFEEQALHLMVYADGEPAAITVVTRLALALERLGGWGEHTVVLPAGTWRDVLTGRDVSGGSVRLADLLQALPVALLVPAGDGVPEAAGHGDPR